MSNVVICDEVVHVGFYQIWGAFGASTLRNQGVSGG
jgi:hypothetical protein